MIAATRRYSYVCRRRDAARHAAAALRCRKSVRREERRAAYGSSVTERVRGVGGVERQAPGTRWRDVICASKE